MLDHCLVLCEPRRLMDPLSDLLQVREDLQGLRSWRHTGPETPLGQLPLLGRAHDPHRGPARTDGPKALFRDRGITVGQDALVLQGYVAVAGLAESDHAVMVAVVALPEVPGELALVFHAPCGPVVPTGSAVVAVFQDAPIRYLVVDPVPVAVLAVIGQAEVVGGRVSDRGPW